MKVTSFIDYLLNCLLLLLPIMAWNLIFASKLPRAYSDEVFSKDIPSFIEYGETFSDRLSSFFQS